MSIVEEIRKLHDLKTEGHLTEAEFAMAKARLLAPLVQDTPQVDEETTAVSEESSPADEQVEISQSSPLSLDSPPPESRPESRPESGPVLEQGPPATASSVKDPARPPLSGPGTPNEEATETAKVADASSPEVAPAQAPAKAPAKEPLKAPHKVSSVPATSVKTLAKNPVAVPDKASSEIDTKFLLYFAVPILLPVFVVIMTITIYSFVSKPDPGYESAKPVAAARTSVKQAPSTPTLREPAQTPTPTPTPTPTHQEVKEDPPSPPSEPAVENAPAQINAPDTEQGDLVVCNTNQDSNPGLPLRTGPSWKGRYSTILPGYQMMDGVVLESMGERKRGWIKVRVAKTGDVGWVITKNKDRRSPGYGSRVVCDRYQDKEVEAAPSTIMTRYVASLGRGDYQNPKGVRFSSAAMVIRQDRVNYHRFRVRHARDGDDPLFHDKGRRARLQELAHKFLKKNRRISRAIMNNSPVIQVTVLGQGGTMDEVKIEILD